MLSQPPCCSGHGGLYCAELWDQIKPFLHYIVSVRHFITGMWKVTDNWDVWSASCLCLLQSNHSGQLLTALLDFTHGWLVMREEGRRSHAQGRLPWRPWECSEDLCQCYHLSGTVSWNSFWSLILMSHINGIKRVVNCWSLGRDYIWMRALGWSCRDWTLVGLWERGPDGHTHAWWLVNGLRTAPSESKRMSILCPWTSKLGQNKPLWKVSYFGYRALGNTLAFGNDGTEVMHTQRLYQTTGNQEGLSKIWLTHGASPLPSLRLGAMAQLGECFLRVLWSPKFQPKHCTNWTQWSCSVSPEHRCSREELQNSMVILS